MLESLQFPEIVLPALVLISLTGLLLLAGRSSRWLLLILGLQYLGVFLFVYLVWPIGLAMVKLAGGWIASLILGIGPVNTAWEEEERFTPSSSIFRVIVALLVILTVFTLRERVQTWFPVVSAEALIGALVLAGLGLLHLGLATHPLRVVIGLLTLLSGFEILYASMERSILVAGLLAALTLGLALVGVYLDVAPGSEESE
jgi:hypothetical protein